MYLISDPVLVAEIVDAVQKGWLLLLLLLLTTLFGVRTVKIECFGFLVADRISARIIEGVIVS